MEKKNIKADIAVLGAGIIGCTVARELSRYSARVVVVDKEADVGWGTTKANSGILHAGYAGEPKSLKLKLSHRGNLLFRKYADELGITIKNTGSLVNAVNREQERELETLYRQGKDNGVANLKIIRANSRIRELEPNIAKDVCAALYAGDACIMSPYEAAIALYENARANGVDFLFDFEVKKVFKEDSFLLFSDDAVIESGYVINACGLYADRIAGMIGDESFSTFPVKGEYLLLDSKVGDYVKRVNFPVTEGIKKKSKGILLTPTVGGNILAGPTYSDCSREDISTSGKGYDEIREKADSYFKNIPFSEVITSFAGIRAVSGTNDFIISASKTEPGFINLGGIQSPGLTCAFPIAETALDLLKDAGIKLEADRHFVPVREPIKKLDQKDYLANRGIWSENRDYGRIVCRCEKVTEAEVIEAIARGARTLDGVKFRTRAGMGRCQGGYCSLKVAHIVARELGIAPQEVTKKGKGSEIFAGKVE
ncbi:MAG: NAD(P)/FAD-dependent oxidoreductase [Actinomycetota bacterium]